VEAYVQNSLVIAQGRAVVLDGSLLNKPMLAWSGLVLRRTPLREGTYTLEYKSIMV
jgi:hypothetical protein